jgi:hypothetical protein
MVITDTSSNSVWNNSVLVNKYKYVGDAKLWVISGTGNVVEISNYIHPEKLIVAQLVKKFPVFYGT